MKLRIRHKLFITLFLTSSIAAACLFFFLQKSFDRGFLTYVKNQELKRMEEMADHLTKYYDEHYGWARLEGNLSLWIHLQKPLLFEERLHDDEPKYRLGFFKGPPPPPVDEIRFGKRIMLLDIDKNRIIGGGSQDKVLDPVIVPVTKDRLTIGYLALYPISELSDSGDLLFVQQQKETFGYVALMMLAISILLSFPVAMHLLRPINYLTDGTRELIGGTFSVRIPITTSDELGRLSEHFNILAKTLEKNEKARRRWIADISHELRTPLAVLRGEMEALLDGVRKAEPNTLEPLHAETLHMQRLVNDLYELSMSDIGALSYKRVQVNPLGILMGAVELFEKRYAEAGLELVMDLPEKVCPSLLGDPDRLQQLFSNLLENSLQYTDAPGKVEITARTSSEEIIVRFQDTAPGVKEEQLPFLFDRLYRTDPSRNRAAGGTGLGLAISLNIAEAHGGEIFSYSSSHGGLGIQIRFPVTH